jgi:hypothetical protein
MADEAGQDENIVEEMKTKAGDLDTFARIIQEKFAEARDYRRDHEQHWQEAYDAYRAKYPSQINKANELASERGIFVNQTRRKVNSAKIKIGTLLFEDGEVPFSVTPSKRPRFYPPDIEVQPDRPDILKDALLARSKNMEDKIRDILRKTNYNDEITHAIHEMCLYGTGCTKGVSLTRKNFPVYTSVRTSEQMDKIESYLEEELVPTVKYISIWNVFPSPEASSTEDADYVIQRSFVSPIQLRSMVNAGEGYIKDVAEEIISGDEGRVHGYDESQHPKKFDETSARQIKNIEVLEFWGRLDGNDLAGHLPMEAADMPQSIPVVVTVVGDKVIKIEENPFDDTLPFHFCYWQKNPESIWADGIYYAIRDVQAILNFSYAMMIEGKSLSAAPMTVIDPNSFEPGTDTEQVYPGKQFRVKPGASVRDAFMPVQIPDVTNGLLQLIQQLEREADLDSGQTSIGYGDNSPAQTKTATGMSILNSNANRQTADVVRSVSKMITSNMQAIYRWLMVDSEDSQIKGDYETISTGYEQYIAKEVHNTQLINFLQTIGSLPQLQQYIKYEAFSRPLLRAFNLDPELVMKTEEEVAQEMQQQTQSQQQAMEQQAQQAAQIAQQQIQAQAQANSQSQIQVQQIKSMLDEKQKISDDQREMERAERLELMKDGNVLHPTNLERHSILLREEENAGEIASMMQEDQEEGQDLQLQQQQLQEIEQQQLQRQQQEQQQEQQQGQGPPPPEGQGGSMAGAPDEGMVEQGEL